MGRERTLLERIAVAGDRSRGRYEPSATEDLEALMDSVRRHLGRLLNSRHGLSEAMPDYGLPALTDLTIGSRDYVHSIQDAIRVAIQKYEPRLQNVRVSRVVHDDAPQTLSFRIDARLVGQKRKYEVFYETSMAGTGAFEVSE